MFDFLAVLPALAEPVKSSLNSNAGPAIEKTGKGGLGLAEFKNDITLALKTSQSRLFYIRDRIIRTSVANVAIAEPLVLAENQICLLGKGPGVTTILLWDDGGHFVSIRVRVQKSGVHSANVIAEIKDKITHSFESPNSETVIETLSAPVLNIEDFTTSPEGQSRLNILRETHGNPLNEKGLTGVSGRSRGAFPSKDQLTVPGGEVEIVTGGSRRAGIKTLDLTASQSRAFTTRRSIARVTCVNPAVSEPIVIEARQFVLLGKTAGNAQLVLEDKDGGSEVIDLRVATAGNHLANAFNLMDSFLHHLFGGHSKSTSIPPVDVPMMALAERKVTRVIELKTGELGVFKTCSSIVRTSISDPGVADATPLMSNETALVGRRPGFCTLFVWDRAGALSRFDLHVSGKALPEGPCHGLLYPHLFEKFAAEHKSQSVTSGGLWQREVWTGTKKDVVSTPAFLSVLSDVPSGDPILDAEALKKLNNEAVLDLSRFDYDMAVLKLEKVLKVAPTYSRARENLAVAYNNYGLTKQKAPVEAIKYFHKSVYLDPDNCTCLGNLKGIILRMGKDPNNFADRVALGDKCLDDGCTTGSIVEYRAALAIHDDAEVRSKLEKALALQDPAHYP